jgi:hypothetical protein
MRTIELIAKEQVPQFKFLSGDVLHTETDKKERFRLLEQAMILGNSYRGKVRIVFETTDGTKSVETTIWHASEDLISLKGGINIPIHSIYEVKLD